jgi:hypothetical protein
MSDQNRSEFRNGSDPTKVGPTVRGVAGFDRAFLRPTGAGRFAGRADWVPLAGADSVWLGSKALVRWPAKPGPSAPAPGTILR